MPASVRILLDECLPARLRRAFPGYVVRTVPEMGLRSTKDSLLLTLCEGKSDVLITVDRTLEREFRRVERRLGLVVVVDLVSNALVSFLPFFDRLLLAAETVKPGEVIHVSARHNRV